MGMEHHNIMEVKKFVDPDGREVLQFTQVFGKGKDPDFYKGRVMVRVQTAAPNGMPMPPQTIPFEFIFPEGIGLKKAFETFDEVAKQEIETHKKNMQEKAEAALQEASRVVPARAMPPILGADGKIMRKG